MHNEDVLLPIWLRYYGGLFGHHNLFVIDDGSDDGSTSSLGPAIVIRRPKMKVDQFARAGTISELVRLLLEHYQIVLFTDVDEFLVADPLLKRELPEYLSRVRLPHMNGFGLNVLHNPLSEADYRPDRPVLEQRRWLQFERAYCKQIAHREPTQYGPGFHLTTAPRNQIPGLYLFHLRAFDYKTSEIRITRRNRLAWADRSINAGHGIQNRMSTEAYMDAFYGPSLQRTLAGALPAQAFNSFVVDKLRSLQYPETSKSGDLVKKGDAVERPSRFAQSIPAATAPFTAVEMARQNADPSDVKIDADKLYDAALEVGLRRAAERPDG